MVLPRVVKRPIQFLSAPAIDSLVIIVFGCCKHNEMNYSTFAVHLHEAVDNSALIICISGMWYSILEFLNVAGVVTNSFLVAFTSSYGRTWEGDPSTTNTTELLFNNVTNTTEQVVFITQHLAGPSKLWLIIGFEVRLLLFRTPSRTH